MLSILYSPHMTSVDNEAGRASGHADVPLSALGWLQATELGRHYAHEDVAGVFCSDLQRARATAELAFAARGLPIVGDARLRECDYGELTQAPRQQVEAEFARRIVEPFPNGESMLMIVRRVGAFLRDRLLAEQPDRARTIPTHLAPFLRRAWASAPRARMDGWPAPGGPP